MAFTSIRKRISHIGQRISEAFGAAEPTKLDEEFLDLEKKSDLIDRFGQELPKKTAAFLHPNPSTRNKMMNSKINERNYEVPESQLAVSLKSFGVMLKGPYGQSLMQTGDTFDKLADIRYCLDNDVKEKFLKPLSTINDEYAKNIEKEKKKLQARRLDYDCKKRRKASDEELQTALQVFSQSLRKTHEGMFNLVSKDEERVTELSGFVKSLLDYHLKCGAALQGLQAYIEKKEREILAKPKTKPNLKTFEQLLVRGSGDGSCNSLSQSVGLILSPQVLESPILQGPCCQALFDFEIENPGELKLTPGDLVTLTDSLNEHWFEGEFNGLTGIFPKSYVRVLVPLRY